MATLSSSRAESGGYAALIVDGGFEAVLWTQFLAAFNDNVYKMIVSVGAVELAANQLLGSRYLALAGAVFVLPFLLFAGYAGWSPGQLESEMKRKSWITFPASLELVFETPPEQLWQKVLQSKGGWKNRLLAQTPEDLSWN